MASASLAGMSSLKGGVGKVDESEGDGSEVDGRWAVHGQTESKDNHDGRE